MPTNVRDPRTLVTPDAFEVDAGLLGTPLAGPWPRLAAMLVDLAVIGFLNAVLDSVGLLVWAAVGVLLLRVALQRTTTRRQAVGVLLRASVGCLGLFVLAVVALVFFVARTDVVDDVRDRILAETEAARLATEELERAAEGGAGGRGGVAGDEPVEAGVTSPGLAVDSLSDAAVLRHYADAVETAEAPDTLLPAPLRSRATRIVARDTLDALERRLEEAREERDDLARELRTTEEALERERNDFTDLLRDVWEQAGSVIGLWSIYFTLTLTLWGGRTVGKRALGLRVVRLDGEPMTWWPAFERAGGYVAGLATGLLGFAQVFWDANRQCIHDKIVGTVVVVDGAEPLAGEVWREAHGAEDSPETGGDGEDVTERGGARR